MISGKSLLRIVLILIFPVTYSILYAQDDRTEEGSGGVERKFSGKEAAEKPPVTDYKIIDFRRDTTYVDTTLNVLKYYRHNYLRRDGLELMPFANVGQGFNPLGYDYSEVRLRPDFGARAKHYNYMKAEDISYFHVPTPFTELYYKTAIQQGHQLDAFFTVNTTERLNLSIAYKGVRSLGEYQNALVSSGNFRLAGNYRSANKRYDLRAHVVVQDIMNQENGGLREDFIPLFIDDEEDFRDRGRMEVNFADANNLLTGRRLYLEHQYALIDSRDSLSYTRLNIGHVSHHERRSFRFNQDQPYENLGPVYTSGALRDKASLTETYTGAFARFDNNLLGTLSAYSGYTDFNYGYDAVLILEDQTITNRLKGNVMEFGASYRKHYRGFELYGKGAINYAGDFEGNYLLGRASYALDANNRAAAGIHINSTAPNYNFLLWQSDYVNYNWQTDFRNIKKQHLQFDLESDKLLNASVSYTGIDDHAYFYRPDSATTTLPAQFSGRVNYLRVKVNREVTVGKFAMDNTLLYQEVINGEAVFKVPKLLGRHTLYYSDYLFKRALFLQMGLSVKYFTSYHLNGYDPVLAEFFIQNEQKFGDFPLVDFYVNAKVQQARIYLKLEHINASFRRNYFSAPGYPYRDFTVRFGLVWNFFM